MESTTIEVNHRRLLVILCILLLALVSVKTVDVTLAKDSDSATNKLISSTVATSIYTSTNSLQMLFPLIYKPLTPPVIFLESAPNKNNQRTIGWTGNYSETALLGYVLEASLDSKFTNPTVWNLDKDITSVSHTPSASFQNIMYYRVRPELGLSYDVWSDNLLVVGNYNDAFSDPSSGWDIRRQDTDDINQSVFYENGNLILRIHGRWDYMLASPVMPTPEPPYRLETKVRLVGVDNLHTYGIVFGGDWNGQTCPNKNYSSCFNHYYRLLVIWFGNNNKLKMQLKRIDFHDNTNQGRGVTLIDWVDVTTNQPSRGYQNWSIETSPSGEIKVYINGNLVGTTTDGNYINDRYFGVIAASNEYAGLRAEFDWYQVNSLNN